MFRCNLQDLGSIISGNLEVPFFKNLRLRKALNRQNQYPLSSPSLSNTDYCAPKCSTNKKSVQKFGQLEIRGKKCPQIKRSHTPMLVAPYAYELFTITIINYNS